MKIVARFEWEAQSLESEAVPGACSVPQSKLAWQASILSCQMKVITVSASQGDCEELMRECAESSQPGMEARAKH